MLKDDGTHRWEQVRECTSHGSSGFIERWRCLECGSFARKDFSGFWAPAGHHWEPFTGAGPCNAALRAERLARSEAYRKHVAHMERMEAVNRGNATRRQEAAKS